MRLVDLNQNYHKNGLWQAPLLPEKYKDLTLSFARSYSAQGRAEIVLKQDLKNQFKHIDDSLFAISLRNPMITETILNEVGEIHYNLDKSIENPSFLKVSQCLSNIDFTGANTLFSALVKAFLSALPLTVALTFLHAQ